MLAVRTLLSRGQDHWWVRMFLFSFPCPVGLGKCHYTPNLHPSDLQAVL